MTISTQSNKIIGLGNGATTSWPYSFLIPSQNVVQVLYTNVAGVITVLSQSQYTISGINNPNGGTVTYPLSGSPIPAGSTLTIIRVLPYQQLTDLINQGGYYPAVVEGMGDTLEMQIQQVAGELVNVIRFPVVDPNSNATLPAAAARAGRYLAFDGNGNPIAVDGTTLSGNVSNYTVIPTGGSVASSLATLFSYEVNVIGFGADPTGVADSTAAFVAAIATGKPVYAPSGVYLVNLTITAGNKALRGDGPGKTFLRPFLNADLFTVDAISGPIQHITLANMTLINTTTGIWTKKTAAKGIVIKGTGSVAPAGQINDYHIYYNLFINGFVNGVDIQARTIWNWWESVFIIDSSQHGFNCTNTYDVNGQAMTLVVVYASQWDGFHIHHTGVLAHYNWTFNLCNSEGNGVDTARAKVSGIYLANCINFNFSGFYSEADGAGVVDGLSYGMRMEGAACYGIVVKGSYFVAAFGGIICSAASASGEISSNVLNYKTGQYGINLLNEGSGSSNPMLSIGPNFISNAGGGLGNYNLPFDANGLYGWTYNGTTPFDYVNNTASPNALNGNALNIGDRSKFNINAGAVAITSLVNAKAGQVVTIACVGGTVVLNAAILTYGASVTLWPGMVVTGLVSGFPAAGKIRLTSVSPLRGSGAFNPGLIANGAAAVSAAIAVTGAAFGDCVTLGVPYDLQATVACAYVSAAGLVQISINNNTGAGVTLGAGTWEVLVNKNWTYQ